MSKPLKMEYKYPKYIPQDIELWSNMMNFCFDVDYSGATANSETYKMRWALLQFGPEYYDIIKLVLSDYNTNIKPDIFTNFINKLKHHENLKEIHSKLKNVYIFDNEKPSIFFERLYALSDSNNSEDIRAIWLDRLPEYIQTDTSLLKRLSVSTTELIEIADAIFDASGNKDKMEKESKSCTRVGQTIISPRTVKDEIDKIQTNLTELQNDFSKKIESTRKLVDKLLEIISTNAITPDNTICIYITL